MARIWLMVACLFLIPTLSLAGEPYPDWTQWRGPSRDGHTGGKPWPSRLTTENFQLLWREKLASGYPGPIITKDRVFVAETKDKKFEIVRALDRKTGKQVWESSWEGALSVIFIAWPNGDWIRSTPAFDGKNLYVGGMRDVLVCLDAETGKEKWRYDFVKESKTPLPPFGFVSSPLVDERGVYVQAGGAFAKLDKHSGKLIWQVLKDEGGTYNSAFSSPIFADLAGRKQLVVQTRTVLAGVDQESGEVLWSKPVPAYKNMNILTPTIANDRLFTSTYGNNSYLFSVSKTDQTWKVGDLWKTKQQGYMSSPIVINGHAYLHLRNQCLTCIRLEDGKERWTTSERFGQYWSMVAQGDKILALDERGILYLLKANPDQYEPLGELKISRQSTWGHLAVSGDEVFIRELNAVAAYRWKSE